MSEPVIETDATEKNHTGENSEQDDSSLSFSQISSFFQGFTLQRLTKKGQDVRKALVDSNLISVWLLLLAMPTLGMGIQIGLFLFGIPCSPYPMWISFFIFSVLALLVHWKCLAGFWGLILLGLFLTCYSFSYCGIDADEYHVPMQFLLREGWNPVFDSTIEKFSTVVDTSTIGLYHTLFLPKTAALCGALVARSTGLWIANSFLGYLLLFVLFRTSFVFAGQMWKCKRINSVLFASAISFSSIFTRMIEGPNDFHFYSALMIAVFSFVMYLKSRSLHDFILVIIASAISSTTKTNGLVNCVLLWVMFVLFSCISTAKSKGKNKEIFWGCLAVTLLVAWIGMSPLITSWIQYGSPFYPIMTFDPKIATVDITSDFRANADGKQMRYLARFVYGWISQDIAVKVCALYYHKPDFNPVFYVSSGIKGLGKSLNLLLAFSIVLLVLSKKNIVSFTGLYLLLSLVFYPIQYIGFLRYFPQAWVIIPLGIYQFCSFPPDWLAKKKKLKQAVCGCFYLAVWLVSFAYLIHVFGYQAKSMIIEGKMQRLLDTFQKEGITFVIPNDFSRSFSLSRRLICGNIDFTVSQGKMTEDFEDDTDLSFLHLKKYYLTYWRSLDEYPVCSSPSAICRFKWLDIFKFFPHPLFYRDSNQKSTFYHPKNDSPQ